MPPPLLPQVLSLVRGLDPYAATRSQCSHINKSECGYKKRIPACVSFCTLLLRGPRPDPSQVSVLPARGLSSAVLKHWEGAIRHPLPRREQPPQLPLEPLSSGRPAACLAPDTEPVCCPSPASASAAPLASISAWPGNSGVQSFLPPGSKAPPHAGFCRKITPRLEQTLESLSPPRCGQPRGPGLSREGLNEAPKHMALTPRSQF